MDLTGQIINNRYKINHLICRGEISDVYRATDIENRKTVAIKTLRSDRTSNRLENIIRFRSDTRAVSKINHQNIIRLYDVGEFIGLHYIVMELVEGMSLSELNEKQELPVNKILRIIIQVCRALEIVHSKNIIHRDIKPSNIFIADCSETVKLIDFGIGHIKEFPEQMSSQNIRESFGHISAEQSGIIKRAVDIRSDLYSIGVLLYRLLTKKIPFNGDDLSSLVHHQITEIPEKCSSLNKNVPAVLDGILFKLLEKEPGERYQSTQGLIADLESVMEGKHEFSPGRRDKSINISYRTKLIGREKEIQRLKTLVENASGGSGSVCFIKGEAGTGKTRLIEELKEHVISRKGLLLDGKCYEGESKEPFAPFKEIINKYVNSYFTYTDERQNIISKDLEEIFPVLGRIITDFNPSMKDIMGDRPELPHLDPAMANERFYETMSRFFTQISSHENCIVFVVDDLHGADEGTLHLLNKLANLSYQSSILIVGLYRKEEAQTKPSLNALISSFNEADITLEELSLGSFNEKELSRFISELIFEDETAVIEVSRFIFSKSKGNPFYAVMLLRQLINEKILFYHNNHWQADFAVMHNLKIPGRIVETIIEKFYFLNDKEYNILSYAAVIGGDIELELLFKLSDLDRSALIEIIDKAISLQILETTDCATDRIRFSHDRIREAFYEAIEPGMRKNLHLLIASTLEQSCKNNLDDVVFSLARHYINGGDDEKSVRYAYPAGVQAKQNYANEDAVIYFEKVLQVLENLNRMDDPLLLMCKEEVGEIYLTIGKYNAAMDIFHEILPLVENNSRKTLIYKQMTSALYRNSDWHDSEIFAARGLSLLDEKLPLKKYQVIVGIIKELHVHLFARIFFRKKKIIDNRKYQNITSFYESLSMIYAISNTLKFVRANLRLVNLSYFHLGKTKEFATGLYGFGAICMYNGFYSLANNYLLESIFIHDQLGNEWGKARALEIMGYKHEFQGEFVEAKEYFNQAYQIFERIGDLKEKSFALNGLEHYYYYTSDYKNAKKINDQFYNIAFKVQDYYSITASYIYYTQIFRELGELDKSLSYGTKAYDLCVEHQIWFNACTSSIELGCSFLASGNTEAAIQCLEEARSLHEKYYFPKQYTICVYHNLVQAYIDDYLKKEHLFSGEERKEQLKKIRKSCGQAIRKTRKWKTYYGSALRVQANCFSLADKEKKAVKKYLEGIELCEKGGRPFEHARTLYEYGLFLAQKGNTKEAKNHFESAYTIFNRIGAGLYLEKLEHLLGIQREYKDQPLTWKLLSRERNKGIRSTIDKINRLKDNERLFRIIIEKAVELTGARSGYLFLKNFETDELELRSLKLTGNFEKQYSRKIVDSVFYSGEKIIKSNAGSDVSTIKAPGPVSELRNTILCVPLLAGENPIGVCYLDSPLVEGSFVEENINLLNLFFFGILSKIESIISRQHPSASSKNSIISKTVTDSTIDKIENAITYINDNNNFLSNISREGLAAYVDINPDNLGKSFKLHTGMRINEYINELRIKYAAKRLLNSNDTILDIAYEAGFESISTFRRAFLKSMNVSPNVYRRDNK